MLKMSFIAAFLLLASPYLFGSVSENSLSLIEAFLRTGNYEQALRLTQSLPQKTALTNLYEGIALMGIGRETDGVLLIERGYSQANTQERGRFLESLHNYLRSPDGAEDVILGFWNQFKKEMHSSNSWRSLVIKSLLKKNQLEEVLNFETPLDHVEILQNKAQAALGLNKLDQLLEEWDKHVFTDPQLRGEYIRVLANAGKKEKALMHFDKLKSIQQKWVAQLQLELGVSLEMPELQEEGYHQLIRLNPLDFEPYRGLASLLFSIKKDRKAEETLLEYLKAHPRKYNGAREIAQVLVDHGRFYSLMEFLKQVRKQWKNPLAFHDVALFAFSHRKDYLGFFQELEKMFPQILGRSWGRKIVDSFMVTELEKVYQALLEYKTIDTAGQSEILASFYEYSKVDPGDWLEELISTLPEADLINRARYFYNQTRFDLVPKILRKKIQKNQVGELPLLLGKAYYREGLFSFSYPILFPLMEENSNDLELLTQVLDMSALDLVFRRDLLQIISKIRMWSSKGAPLPVKLIRLIEFYEYEQNILLGQGSGQLPANLTNEDHQYLSIIKDLANSQLDDGLEKMKTFLHNQLDSVHYPKLQEIYLKALELKSALPDSAPKLLRCLLLMQSGDLPRFSDSLNKELDQLEGNPALVLIEDLKLYANSLQIRRELSLPSSDQKEEERLKLLADYESVAWKLVEEFSQSLYTPGVIENLIEELDHEGLHSRKEEALRKVLLKRSSDLLAQKLRNKLL